MEKSTDKVYIIGQDRNVLAAKVVEKFKSMDISCDLFCRLPEFLYYNDNGEVKSTEVDSLLGQLIMTHPDWKELSVEFDIEPDYSFKVHDIVEYHCNSEITYYEVVELANKDGEPWYKLKNNTTTVLLPEDFLYPHKEAFTYKDLEKQHKEKSGWIIDYKSEISPILNTMQFQYSNKHVFKTLKEAKSALAMAQISQLIELPEYGGKITDEEWITKEDNNNNLFYKYVLYRGYDNKVRTSGVLSNYYFLAFHTKKQRDLFYENNKQLVHDYLMID